MATNPYVNKVQFGNQTVMDISDTTANESDVISGKTFYKASGQRSTGTASLDEKMSYADNGVLGSKNMFPFPYRHRTGRESRGITYIVNDDGSVTFSGVATGESNFNFIANDYFPEKLKGKHLFMMGGLSQSIRLQLWKTGGVVANDTGDGADFTFSNSIYEADSFNLSIIVDGGTDVSTPVTIYPMLMLYTYSDITYQPPTETNLELSRSKVSYVDNAILGAKNRFPFAASSSTQGGYTFTANSNGTVSVSGSDSTEQYLNLTASRVNLSDHPIETGMIFSGCEGGSATTYWLTIAFYDSNNQSISGSSIILYEGKRTITVPSNAAKYRCYITIHNTSVSNLVFNPMLRLASDPDDTYVPYAMTNRELTDQTNKAYVTDDDLQYAIDNADSIPYYDTSASKKTRIRWTDIKSSLKTYLDDFFTTFTQLLNQSRGAETEIKDTVGFVRKNYLHIDSTFVTTTVSGVTFTVARNSEGEVTDITTSGTANADIKQRIGVVSAGETSEGKLYLSGCPENGSSSTYYMSGEAENSQYPYLHNCFDYGDAYSDSNGYYPEYEDIFYIEIKSGTSMGYKVFRPMITKEGVVRGKEYFEPYTDREVVGGGGTWGSITGTLSDQTDLQTALDAKANSSSIGSSNLTITQGTSTLATFSANAKSAVSCAIPKPSIVFQSYKSSSVSLAANTGTGVTISGISKSGYTPVAAFYSTNSVSNNSFVPVNCIRIPSSGSVTFYVRNLASSAYTGTITIYVMFAANLS